VTPPTLPSLIADRHVRVWTSSAHTVGTGPEHTQAAVGGQSLTSRCDNCDEPWPCATVRLFRECREALNAHRATWAEHPDPVCFALLARLTEEVTP
jgi:hypothetical protein